MSPSKQCAHPHSFPHSASLYSHRSPLDCHSFSLQSFSFCTWPMAVWSSLLHMNNNIWLFRQKPSDSAVSTVFYHLISSFLFFPSFLFLHLFSTKSSYFSLFLSFFLFVFINLAGYGSCRSFLYIVSLSFLSQPLFFLRVNSLMDAKKLTLPTAMSACCCVGGITEGWGGVCHIHRTGRAQ